MARIGLPNRSVPKLAAGALSAPELEEVDPELASEPDSPSTLRIKVLNSNSSNTSLKTGSFTASNSNPLISKSTGTCVSIVANHLLILACSTCNRIFSCNFPLSLSVFSKMASMLPNSWINFLAVFSPTPGTPGILSDASPHKPKISITCRGS